MAEMLALTFRLVLQMALYLYNIARYEIGDKQEYTTTTGGAVERLETQHRRKRSISR